MSSVRLEFEKPIVELEKKLSQLRESMDILEFENNREAQALQKQLEKVRTEIYSTLGAWQRVQIARHPQRPFALDYLRIAFDDFVELHGDRLFGDDLAMPGGLATIGDFRVVVVSHQKGRDVKENIRRNFGSAHPEGYRKSLRLMRLAEKFGLPVVALIDTPGAYPGVGAEERHISESIAVNLREMMVLKTPIIAVVLGEGGSGGALGIGIADRVLMMENAYYSVISPEGCAAILWKHRSHAPAAAEALKLSATELKKFGMCDAIIPEPLGGAHFDPAAAAKNFRDVVLANLKEVTQLKIADLLPARYNKFRQFGEVDLGEKPKLAE